MKLSCLAAAILAFALTAVLHAQAPGDTAIKAMMQKSVEDWNRGDIDSFATCYKKSPDILFIGRKISRGYDQMVATYTTNYSTREKMGTLSFSALETQPLDEHFATVTSTPHESGQSCVQTAWTTLVLVMGWEVVWAVTLAAGTVIDIL